MKFEELIKSHGFEPSSFHRAVNLERQSIYSYRKGTAKPSADNLTKIAAVLHVSTDDVLACFA